MNNIDYVVPYCINSKEKIKVLMQNYNYKGMISNDKELSKRYNKEDKIFQMHVRSIAKNMPWINTFHLIVENDDHIPEWLDTNKVHIVYHKDFIIDYPSYNPCCMEYFLCKIPNLSEYFIYGNSDYIVTKPLRHEDFFEDDKTKHVFVPLIDNNTQWMTIFINSYKLIYGINSTSPIGPLLHSLTPIVKSRANELYNKYKNELLSTLTKFRSTINYNQYIYPLYDKINNMTLSSNLTAYTTEGYYNYDKFMNSDVVCLENIDDSHPLISKTENLYKFEKCKFEK